MKLVFLRKLRRVCLYMGFVNDIRRKNVAVKGRLLLFDPLDNNLFWPSHPSLGGYVFFRPS